MGLTEQGPFMPHPRDVISTTKLNSFSTFMMKEHKENAV
jgi:hypothetical protein